MIDLRVFAWKTINKKDNLLLKIATKPVAKKFMAMAIF